MIRAGIIGLSEGNGHPFSFSAIINGYDERAFAETGWPVILDYLRRQPPESFGFKDVRVTRAWTQSPTQTENLCAACLIEQPVTRPEDMLDDIDVLIVARDDWEVHAPLAMPALERGLRVFVDKPLTLDMDELERFQPYLESGRLMSTAGLRYAGELDSIRENFDALGGVRLVAGTVLNGLERYGIHLIDAVIGAGMPMPRSVTRLDSPHQSYSLLLEDGTQFLLNCLGNVGKTFHLSFFGESGAFHADLYNNFVAFRRTLDAFFTMVKTGAPPYDPRQTLYVMRMISAANALQPGQTWSLTS